MQNSRTLIVSAVMNNQSMTATCESSIQATVSPTCSKTVQLTVRQKPRPGCSLLDHISPENATIVSDATQTFFAVDVFGNPVTNLIDWYLTNSQNCTAVIEEYLSRRYTIKGLNSSADSCNITVTAKEKYNDCSASAILTVRPR